ATIPRPGYRRRGEGFAGEAEKIAGDQRPYAPAQKADLQLRAARKRLGRERTGLIDVSTAEAAASQTTQAATATAPRLVCAVRREEGEDWGRCWRPRTYLSFGDVEGALDTLRVECTKCPRKGRYISAKGAPICSWAMCRASSPSIAISSGRPIMKKLGML